MPEGHLLHRLAQDLRELLDCPLAVSSPQGRFAEAGLLNGCLLRAAEAYGKHLLLRFDPGVVHVHLGMQGKFVRLEPPTRARPQVRLRLETERVAWDLIAPSRCELMDDAGVAALMARLGPDPLRADADPELVWRRFAEDPRAVGAVLLDQSVLAGVGNVLRAEALFAAGTAPSRPACDVDRAEFDRLWAALRAMMQQAVEDGRIITVDAHTTGGRARTEIPEAEARFVYKQASCRRCHSPIAVASVGSRDAYTCPRCQR